MTIPEGATQQEQEEKIDELLRDLTLEEKVAMLSGHGFMEQIAADEGRYGASLYNLGAGNERLGVPPLLFNDGPRGIAMGNSTCFPVPMARGASFDVDLEERIGDAIGRELRAHGGNLFGGVCINLLRHPAWGRAQETYGEDSFLLGEMGSALTRGVTRHNVIATPKHFAANSMENARFTVDVRVDERALREVYLPHFKRCIDAGAGAVMSAYNQLNGHYCGHNHRLLTEILKDEWGFDGFVYSDFVLGCRGWDAFGAGLDVEAPDTRHFGKHLQEAVLRGEIDGARIDDGVRRVLRSLFRTLAAPDPEIYGSDVIACDAHRKLAREAAAKGIVLLENRGQLGNRGQSGNRGQLPWNTATPTRLLVVGPLAAVPNLGDHGSSRVYPPEVITPLDGIRAAAPAGWRIAHDDGKDLARVGDLAAGSDLVLVVAGYTHRDEGEFIPGQAVDLGGEQTMSIGGDRTDLTLGKTQEALIEVLATANANTVVAVMAGSAVLMEGWRDRVAAILLLFYPGMAGGAALADVLFGKVNPSGRLPFTIPKRSEDLPLFDREATAITYDLWHGYVKLERDETEPAYPFGYGLSYTDFAFANPAAAEVRGGESIRVQVDVTNAGSAAGTAVVQVYAGRATPNPEHPAKRLCGFARAELSPAETVRVEVEVRIRDLAFYDVEAGNWRLGCEAWRIFVGSSSAGSDLREIEIELEDRSWS